MFRSIRLRLSLSFAGIALVAALALGTVLLAALRDYYARLEIDYLRRNAKAVGDLVAAMSSDNLPQDEVQSRIESLTLFTQTRIQVFGPDNNLLYDSGSPQNMEVKLGVPKSLLPGEINSSVPATGERRKIMTIISIDPKGDALYQSPDAATPPVETQRETFLFGFRETVPVADSPFGFDLSAGASPSSPRSSHAVVELIVEKNGSKLGSVKLSEGPDYGGAVLRSVARGWAFASSIAVLLAAGMGWYISRRISAPILALTDVTGRMAQGDLSGRANVQSRDEFGQLGRSFNEMAAQVETTVSTLRRFVADAAHELRTPLTVLRTNLDLMLDEKDAASRAVFVADAKVMVQRLEELNTNLLDLSRLEASDHAARDVIVDLTELLQARSEVYASQVEQSGLIFEQDLPSEPVFVRADPSKMMRAIDNLIDNACKFTPQDGMVRITLSQQDGLVNLSVADTGIGIPEDDLPQLFHRFHRGRNTTTYPGSGLGLAIVKAIVSAHAGRVEVQSAGVGQGSKFSVMLPAVLPPELSS